MAIKKGKHSLKRTGIFLVGNTELNLTGLRSGWILFRLGFILTKIFIFTDPTHAHSYLWFRGSGELFKYQTGEAKKSKRRCCQNTKFKISKKQFAWISIISPHLDPRFRLSPFAFRFMRKRLLSNESWSWLKIRSVNCDLDQNRIM
jgi:hypothetical protein